MNEKRDIQIKIKTVNENIKIPTQGTKGAAGSDIYANVEKPLVILPHETVKIPTGISTEMPEGIVALIYSRSGMATQKGLVVCQGTAVIDSDYRGEWIIPIHNDTNKIQNVSPGERIAQVIFTEYLQPVFTISNTLSNTGRGDAGFGSTGK